MAKTDSRSLLLNALLSAALLIGYGDAFLSTAASSAPHHQTTRSFKKRHVMALNKAASSSDDQERMELVRQLQKTFYASSEEDRVELDETTGRVLNLPLWRVGWVECPGRTNCLNVHEGHYTNMFEKILSDPDPDKWLFGHLHLPGGTSNARSGERRFELKDWLDESQDENRFDERERSAVVGCFMRIADYRRLEDGRLCLLVQAVDRFVVDEVVQSFPHGVAHVQILPDTDQVQLPGDAVDENFGKPARASAVRRSFQYYDYECDRLPLPLPKDSDYLATDSVFGAEIAKLLPFCAYANDDSVLSGIDSDSESKSDSNSSGDAEIAPQFAGGEPSLEARLQADLILRNPSPLPGVTRRETDNADALETLLWLALEDLCRNYRFKLPQEILCLMPAAMSYLDLPPAERSPLSDKYPASRRQQRLSYSVPALIENTNIGDPIPTRQMLLNTPSTRARLAAVLERIEAMNEAVTGKFQ